MIKFVFITTGNGYQLEKALEFDFFKQALYCVVSNSDCRALSIANKYGIKTKIIKEDFNENLNMFLIENKVDYIFSQNNRIIFDMKKLYTYNKKIFNLHNSILPAFKGTKEDLNKKSKFNISQIFERQVEFGSLFLGVTIHLVVQKVDSGPPVFASIMNRPYDEDLFLLRHRMFIQEVKLMLQFVKWLIDDRLFFDSGIAKIRDAKFDILEYTPNLDDEKIINYNFDFEGEI